MIKKQKNYTQSKVGKILKERNITQKEFAAMLFIKTGYLIAPTNLSNVCSGFRKITKLNMAIAFAKTLDVKVDDIV